MTARGIALRLVLGVAGGASWALYGPVGYLLVLAAALATMFIALDALDAERGAA